MKIYLILSNFIQFIRHRYIETCVI